MICTTSLCFCLLTVSPAPALTTQDPAPQTFAAAEHAHRYERLLVRNVLVIEGDGTPIRGPTDIVIEKDRIASIGKAGAGEVFDAVIEGEGRTAIPGLINLHGHLHDERAGIEMPYQYQLDLWLASGITTVRDLGSDRGRALEARRASDAGEVPSPRIFLYMVAGGETAEEARESVRGIQEAHADGIKVVSMDRESFLAVLEEAHTAGLRVAHHIGVEDTDAWDDIAGGTTTIEHWYGIPDAALPYGSQQFPPDYNYSNELDRFRWAGHLWREVDPEKLGQVLQGMVDAGVAWDPTLSIYEATRDANAAQNQPWFADYLHPALAKFFEPNLESHGSFFLGWTTADEIAWRDNYQHWFAALREFAARGGTIGTGEDAGYIYRVYGFGLIRELELQQEAGFHPLDVLKHATANGAKILGREHDLGRLKKGFKADVALVNGNPLANFKLLYPTGTFVQDGDKATRGGTVEWTIKDGYCYRGAVLMEDVRQIVAKARNTGDVSATR
jgi:cytosine/adenosine deaminase-related metal-dependent hydrolase